MVSLQHLAAVCGFWLASPLLATTLIVSTPTPNVSAGTPVLVRVTFSTAEDAVAQALGAYDLLLSFDPNLLILNSVMYGDPVYGDQLDLTGYGTLTFDDTSTPGEVRMMEVSLDDPLTLERYQLDHFGVAEILFDTKGPGVSNLNLTVNAIGDAYGFSMEVQTIGGALAVGETMVPEPALYILVGSGLAAFGIVRRHRRRP